MRRQPSQDLLDGRLDFAESSRQGLHRSDVPMQRRGAALLWLAAPIVIYFGCGSFVSPYNMVVSGSRGIDLTHFGIACGGGRCACACAHVHAFATFSFHAILLPFVAPLRAARGPPCRPSVVGVGPRSVFIGASTGGPPREPMCICCTNFCRCLQLSATVGSVR